VKVPAGSKPGRVLRVRGRGVKTAKGSGDLLATIEVTVPGKLTDEQRDAVERLAEVL
jgi:molecular chaperone DnaJ